MQYVYCLDELFMMNLKSANKIHVIRPRITDMVFAVLLRLAQIKFMLLLLFLFIPIHVPLENVVCETTSVKRINWWHRGIFRLKRQLPKIQLDTRSKL